MDPKLIGEISQLMGSLPPPLMMQMQTIMHNTMAGMDVQKEVQAFESSLPPGFREKMAKIMYQASGVDVESSAVTSTGPSLVMNSADEARLTVLRAVKDGNLSPEAALQALFHND
jgi:hypothetical protein